jgi:hypothetical protein
MEGAGSPACPGLTGATGRYLSGLCAAGLGLCAAGWLVLTPFAFGYQGRGWHAAARTDLATGGALAVICLTTLIAWTLAWRRALRADGVLSRPEPGPARVRRRRERTDTEQVLTALRTLLTPALDLHPQDVPAVAAVIPGPRSGGDEEEVW